MLRKPTYSLWEGKGSVHSLGNRTNVVDWSLEPVLKKIILTKGAVQTTITLPFSESNKGFPICCQSSGLQEHVTSIFKS